MRLSCGLATLLLIGGVGRAPVLQSQAVPEWRFTEELRIGSERDDPTGFSDVRGILVDRKGNIWVIEASTQEIRVFDPAGKHLRNIGRKGQGPGEFLYADGMAMAPDGLVWVHDPQNARFSIFDQAGMYVRQQLAPANGFGFVWTGGIDRSGRVWDRIISSDPHDPLAVHMKRANRDWTRVDTVSLPRCFKSGVDAEAGVFKVPHGMAAVPFFPEPVSAIDYDGGAAWCAPSSAEYRFSKIGIERGDTLARIKISAKPVVVSAAERDSEIARLRRFARGVSLDLSRIPKRKPIVQSAFVDGEGRLWVRRSGSDDQPVFDLYSPVGKPLAAVHLGVPVNDYKKPVIRGAIAYFISQEAGEVPYIVRGRLGPAQP